MAVKIRLMRIGSRGRPYYRIVVVSERVKRGGKYLELLGNYNPIVEPKQISINQERVDYWVSKGAQESVGFLRITGRAPQRKRRASKKVRVKAQTSLSEKKGETKE